MTIVANNRGQMLPRLRKTTASRILVNLSSENGAQNRFRDLPRMALRRADIYQTFAIRTAKDLNVGTNLDRVPFTESSGSVASSRDERENLRIQLTMLCKQLHSRRRCGAPAS